MSYDVNGWNWQDTVAMIVTWIVLPAFLFYMKHRSDRRWRRVRERDLLDELLTLEKYFGKREKPQ
jgi:hypothetical protein